MSSGGGRRGRRDNGLVAAEYAVAGDVDPRVGEHLLDVLAAGGIAAYLQPAADLHPVTRNTTVPPRPADRLYVDRKYLGTARNHLAELAEPGSPAGTSRTDVAGAGAAGAEGAATQPDPADVDAAFARIVADLETDPTPPAETAQEADRDAADRTPARRAREADEPSLLYGLDTFGADLPDEDEGSYTPPPPPPIPRPSAAAVVAVLAVLAGFTLFVWPGLVPFDEDIARMLGLAGCVAGVLGLIWRLRPGDEEDENRDPDDGARV